MQQPNFFIAGAPKCGTTALSEYLREHPRIFISEYKEPHYFATDFPNYPKPASFAEYLDLFREAESKHLAVGEASVLYLYSQDAIANLYRFNPQAKIVVMLRNPVDLVYSYHSQLLYISYETEENFVKAWELQASRRGGNNIPPLCTEPRVLQYSEVGKLGEQMARLLRIFPREQVHPILFEDFVRDTQKVYENVLEFLNVPPDNRREFPPINENKVQKVKWLGQFLQHPPKSLTNAVAKTKKIVGIERLEIMEKLRNINSQKTKRQTLEQDFRASAIAEFKDDIGRLSLLLNRNLDHWLQ